MRSARRTAHTYAYVSLGLVLALVAGIGWLWFGSDWGEPLRAQRSATAGPVSPDSPIEHVVFIIKENRTFDHYFGRFPGADGATEGGTLRCIANGREPGASIPLPAPDTQLHDITHGFASGLYAINGGEMNGFNIIGGAKDLTGYVQHARDSIPAYWAYADRFVLADRFFTSMYGPTFPEHLFTVAAQSFGIVDNPSADDPGTVTTGSRCEVHGGHQRRGYLPDRRPRGWDHARDSRAARADRAVREQTISCFDIEVFARPA